MRVAINGFGRIGRLVFREWLSGRYKNLDIVSVNDLSSSSVTSHLLKYDSTHGVLPYDIDARDNEIVVNGKSVRHTSKQDANDLDLSDVDLVFECTGKYKSRKTCGAYINAGSKKVLISAPGEDVDFTVVYGVNDDKLSNDHVFISNASCTTNCLAPLIKVLDRSVGIQCGHMSTVHSYTCDQRLVDAGHKDLRRARAAASNIIPTSTGAAKAIGLIFPELSGKLHGSALRVPVQNVSLVEFTFISKVATSVEEINALMLKASNSDLNGVLGYSNKQLVSSDFNTTRYSATFDSTLTSVVDETLCTVVAWYDNEYGFSCRMLDVAERLAGL